MLAREYNLLYSGPGKKLKLTCPKGCMRCEDEEPEDPRSSKGPSTVQLQWALFKTNLGPFWQHFQYVHLRH